MKVVAFAIAPVMMHRRHDWNTTAYAFRHRALQRGLPWKRRGRHDGFSMTSSVGSKAEEPYTAYLVQANTDRTSFTYILSFFFIFSFLLHAVKLWNIDAWNLTYDEILGRNWKKILEISNACPTNIIQFIIITLYILEKKKKIARSRKFISVLERVLSKIYQIVEIPATIFSVF